jgi:hypothetical protein
MPKGSQGQKRPADVIGNAVHVMRIATGEAKDEARPSKTEVRSLAGKKGGKARAVKIGEDRRSAIAKKAANTRWRKARQTTE